MRCGKFQYPHDTSCSLLGHQCRSEVSYGYPAVGGVYISPPPTFEAERDYIYCRALASRIRDASRVERLEQVELTHLRMEVTYEGSLVVEHGEGEVKTIFGGGLGRKTEPEPEHLSEIVAELNERFGLKLNDQDQFLFDQFEETWVTDPEVVAQAKGNSLESFRLVFDDRFLDTVVSRMDDNELSSPYTRR